MSGDARVYKPPRNKFDDITGSRFGKLVVKSLLGSYKTRLYWLCECDCGGTSEVSTNSLNMGGSRSCGCENLKGLRKRIDSLPDLVGQSFGRLTVIAHAHTEDYERVWLCRCSCGAHTMVPTGRLNGGNTKSCGCLRRDVRAALNSVEKLKHGLSHTRAYVAWGNMMRRCTDPNDTHFHRYGGRGIAVEPYLQVFENFFEYMGECPEGLTLDRVENDGGYMRGNLRWATDKEQQNNKSDNVLVDVGDGSKLTATQLAEAIGEKAGRVIRMVNNGKSLDEILKVPRGTKVIVYWKGEPTSLLHVSEVTGLPYQRLWARIHRQGLSVDEAVEKG